jgi:predicted anti-sigma-YlaC factor YlaD
MNALEANLEIKLNDVSNCREFFNRVKENKKILSEVQSSEKYKNTNESTQ